MDKVIVTALLVIGGVTAAVVVIITIGPSIGSSRQSVVESQREASGRIKTAIEIIAVASNSTGDRVGVFVKNVGVDTIIAIKRSDVFLIKSGTRFDAMKYDSSLTGSNVWSGDLEESGDDWIRGDALHIVISPARSSRRVTTCSGSQLPTASPPRRLSAGNSRRWELASRGSSS